MKKHRNKTIVQITDPEIEEYTLKLTSKESELVKAVVTSSGKDLDFIDILCSNLVGRC